MMMTKTEELLGDVNRSLGDFKGFANITKLENHLAPLIAKERIIEMLREIDKGEDTEWAPRKYTVQLINGELDITGDKPFTRVDPKLYSTVSGWHRVTVEEPDLIMEAMGWDKL